jgi:ABC-type transporter Mla subunit MlaD
MDSTALHALIAEVRGTAAALAEAEQRVASFTAELAQQDQTAHPATAPIQQTPTLISKRGNSGWVPAG